MANVRFIQTKKQKWIYRVENDTCDPTALYFCTDTGELFKGSTSFTAGIRIVDKLPELPNSAGLVADNTLYYCIEDKKLYLISTDRSEWIEITSGTSHDIDAIVTDKINTTLSSDAVVLDGGDIGANSVEVETNGGNV